MYLSKNDLLQLDTLNIYNLVKKDLDSFYSSHNNIIINKDEYKDIILDEIESFKQEIENNNQQSYTNISLKSILIDRVNKRIRIEIAIREKPEYQNFVQILKNHKLLQQEEINELTIKAQSGDVEARNIIVSHNLKLVVKTAKKYMGLGVELDDLIQEGIIGLISAVNKFDVTRGTMFSTYAMFHIRNSIYQSIYNTSRNVRLPIHQYENIFKYKRTAKKLTNQLNREPTLEEIADEMHISFNKALQIYNILIDTVSINKKISSVESDELELGDTIASNVEIDDVVMNDMMKDDLKNALYTSNLTERELYVIINRFGLFDCNRKTLDYLGQKLNITRERVRQVEKKGIEKLTRTKRGRSLAYYVSDSLKDNTKNTVEYEEYKNIYDKLPPDIFDYLFECGLTSFEMMVVSLSLGLINMNPISTKEIIAITGKSSNYVYSNLKKGLSKLKDGYNKDKFTEYISQIEENKKNRTEKIKSELYDSFGCTKEEFERIYNRFSENEKKIINKRMKINYDKIMTKNEQYTFDKSLTRKIKKYLSENRKEKEKIEELNRVNKQINSSSENKDKELVSIINKAYDTNLFKELNKIISIKESIAILLIYGYIYDSYYPISYVSKLLDISNESIYKAEKKVEFIFKNISKEEQEKVKELLKK